MKRIRLPWWMKWGLSRLRWRIAVETISLCLMACAPVVSAKLSQYAIDDVIGMRSVTNFRLLLILCVFYIAVFIALKYSIAWVSATTRQRFALDVRERLWGRWVDEANFSVQGAGEISNRILGDIYSSGDVAIMALSTLFVCIGTLCVCLVMLFKCNHIMACIALSFVPAHIVLYRIFGEKVRCATKDSLAASDGIVRFVVHRWTNIDEIRTLNGGLSERMEFHGMAHNVFRSGQRMLFVKNIAGGMSETVLVIWNLLLFSFGAYLVLRDSITLGELISVQMIAAQIVSPVQRLLNLGLSLNMLKVKIMRVMNVDSTCAAVNSAPNVDLVHHYALDLIGAIFDSANEVDASAISLHLKVSSGRRCYIEGMNGAGKSSVCRLIAGLRIQSSGTIVVNGRELQPNEVRGMRNKALLMTCRPFFFAGTVRDNLLYGLNRHQGDEALRSALNMVGLNSWIENLRGGLDFRIEDNGANLSNGQRQRLQCARVLLRPGELAVVDEALSGIGEADASLILDRLNEGRSLIITRISSDPVLSVKQE